MAQTAGVVQIVNPESSGKPSLLSSSSSGKQRDMPRRPLSAYNLFFRSERRKLIAKACKTPEEAARFQVQSDKKKRPHTRTHGIGFAKMARQIAKNWKSLDAPTRALYEEGAKKDKLRYQRELDDWRNAKKAEESSLSLSSASLQLMHPGLIQTLLKNAESDWSLRCQNQSNLPNAAQRFSQSRVMSSQTATTLCAPGPATCASQSQNGYKEVDIVTLSPTQQPPIVWHGANEGSAAVGGLHLPQPARAMQMREVTLGPEGHSLHESTMQGILHQPQFNASQVFPHSGNSSAAIGTTPLPASMQPTVRTTAALNTLAIPEQNRILQAAQTPATGAAPALVETAEDGATTSALGYVNESNKATVLANVQFATGPVNVDSSWNKFLEDILNPTASESSAAAIQHVLHEGAPRETKKDGFVPNAVSVSAEGSELDYDGHEKAPTVSTWCDYPCLLEAQKQRGEYLQAAYMQQGDFTGLQLLGTRNELGTVGMQSEQAPDLYDHDFAKKLLEDDDICRHLTPL